MKQTCRCLLLARPEQSGDRRRLDTFQAGSLLFQMIPRLVLTLAFLALAVSGAGAVNVRIDDFKVNTENITADVSVADLPPDFYQAIDDGIEKRLEFQVELYRIWSLWLDEFIGGTEIVGTIKHDLLKGEYVTTVERDGTLSRDMWKNRDEALLRITRFTGVPVFSPRDAQRGTFYVRVRVRSRVRELPPIVGGLFFFVPEVEFQVEAKSPRFPLHK